MIFAFIFASMEVTAAAPGCVGVRCARVALCGSPSRATVMRWPLRATRLAVRSKSMTLTDENFYREVLEGTMLALVVFSAEWCGQRKLGRADFTFGQFGENFTAEGMLDDTIHIGDVFRVGRALVEVTQPRVPCFKLGIKMGLAQFPKMFLNSCRVGFYLRVLEEGEVGEGDLFEQVKTEPERMSVSEACHLLYFDQKNLEGAQKALRIQALSPGWKGSFKDRLTKTRAPIEYSEEPAEGEKCCGP